MYFYLALLRIAARASGLKLDSLHYLSDQASKINSFSEFVAFPKSEFPAEEWLNPAMIHRT